MNEEYKKYQRGRPMKRSKPQETEHVIHPDGTYSNTPTKETVAPAPSPPTRVWMPMDVVKVKSGAHYQVIKPVKGGYYIHTYPYKVCPRVQDCEFWDSRKMEEEVV